jgi:enamine deaminase RidA (YjgF/YER057c/UK114 family)
LTINQAVSSQAQRPNKIRKENVMVDRNKDAQRGLRFVNPPGLYDPAPNGYSHLALFPPGWRVILPAGQGGETENQELSDDFATVLKAADAKMSDVAKINLLIVDHDKERFRVMTEEVERVWGDNKPAMTLIPVPALALEGMLVEIDVIAVVPA